MRRLASEINSLATQYQKLISDLYNRFSNMPFTTGEWIGNQAEKYVNIVLLDKSDMMSVGDRIKDFSKVITDDANLLESSCSKIMEDEENE
jgi:hypothetical protein